MGKNAKFKKLRRLATKLPEMTDTVTVTKIVSGADVLKQGVKEVDGKPVVSSLNYKQTGKQKVPLNHYKNMKKYYKDFGVKGASGYAGAILKHAELNKTANALP